MRVLLPADAENKLFNKKLYLVIDLDETLVYSSRLKPGSAPRGLLINVNGNQYDVVLRPGLAHFLSVMRERYIMFLYTMGDAEYTRAVLAIIDPDGESFKGGVCAWRSSESRTNKSLARVGCERRMALIVDDCIDVWRDDLPNLCLTRRFVGNAADDGLQTLSWQLQEAHAQFFGNAPEAGFSLESSDTARVPPSLPAVVGSSRSDILAGCTIALTGVVSSETDAAFPLEQQPLCVLIKLYGGELTTNVEVATHLVARKKDGWKNSPKIRRALERVQAADTAFFYAVWDHWLLDTLCSWQRQSEASYAIEQPAERDSPPGEPEGSALFCTGQRADHITESPGGPVAIPGGELTEIAVSEAVDSEAAGGANQVVDADAVLRPRKRPRADLDGDSKPQLSVADFLQVSDSMDSTEH